MNWVRKSMNYLAVRSNELGDMKIIQPFPTIKSWAKVKRTKLQLDKYCQISRLAACVRGKGQSQDTTQLIYIYIPIYFWKMYIFQKTWNTHNCFLLPISFFYEVPQKSIWLPAPDINMEEGHIPSCPLRTFLFRKCDLLHNFWPCKASATFCTIMVICKTHHPPLYKELKCTQEIPTTAALNLNFWLNFELKDFVL